MYPEGHVIAEGKAAWGRLRQRSRKTWPDWCAVGHAILVLRKDALMEARTNKPYGKIYTRIMAARLREHGLDEIEQQVRWRLLQCLEHEQSIGAWLESLSDQQRMKLNHPDSIWMNFQIFAPGRQVHNRKSVVEMNCDHVGRLPPHPDQDTIRRIATELREHWTTDVFKLAVVAYHAVLRPAPPPKPVRRTAAELEATHVHV